jgi:hypothetical protein
MKFLTFLFGLLLFISCHKTVNKTDPEYIGIWAQKRTDTKDCGPYVLEISASGHGRYYSTSREHECSSGERNSFKGKIKKEQNDLVLIRVLKRRFHIDQPPKQISTVKLDTAYGLAECSETMTLDGQDYYKVN